MPHATQRRDRQGAIDMTRQGRRLGRFILPAVLASALGAATLASADSLFVQTGSLITPRDSHTATRLASGGVRAAGGLNWGTTVATAEIYNPCTGTWTQTSTTMHTARSQHTATLLNDGRVLVVGGMSSDGFTPVTDVEVYNPATDRFTSVGALSIGR